MFRFENLVEAFQSNLNKEEHGIIFINGERDEYYVPYAKIFYEALCILNYLQSEGIDKGDELVLQIENTEHFVKVFWACLLGGIIPVPVAVGNNDEHKLKLFGIWNKLNRPHLATTISVLENLKVFASGVCMNKEMKEMEENTISLEKLKDLNIKGRIVNPQPDDIAFIQFSSGSTGNPKGVTLTHRNLMANITAMIHSAELVRNDSMLSWMPLTHDLGLIGFHIAPLVLNVDQHIMPTSLFIRHPKLWIDKIDEHKTTITASPNFGYQYFMTFLKKRPVVHWDLSHVRLIFNGAEPVSAKLCEKFLDYMGQYGLRKDSMFTVYGLAEASLAVTFPPLGEGMVSVHVERDSLNIGSKVRVSTIKSDKTVTFVDLGYPVDFCSVKICDDENNVLNENTVGYVNIKGINVTKGYYNDKEVTERTITRDGWLNTGDLGFITNGRLIITGRAKDIIFVNGQNFYPHDIERVAEGIGKINPGEVVATGIFSHEMQRDLILVFVLYKKPLEGFAALACNLKKYILKKMGLEINYVIPVKKIPKTTSGKVQRYKLIERYENKEFDSLIEELEEAEKIIHKNEPGFVPIDEIEENILEICKSVIGINRIGINDNLIEYGGNSILLHLLHAQLEELYPGRTKISDLFTYPTVSKLSKFIKYGENGFETGDISYKRVEPKSSGELESKHRDIAIIGLAARLPGAENIGEFWENIKNGICCVGDFPDTRRSDINDYLDFKKHNIDEVKYSKGSYIKEIDKFDYSYFKISPNEACLMNPIQRIFLETVWQAVEDSGYGGGKLAGSNTGIYAGQISDLEAYKYKEIIHDVDPDLLPLSAAGNISAIIPNRISYTLDLKGPSMVVDTACSSSLVALHVACQALRNGECDTAIVGSAKVNFIPIDKEYYKIGIESSDYMTRSFDRQADGSGSGEGVVAFVIKPLNKALDDRDNIYAVIKGSAVNQDGTSMGITAPNSAAQSEVIVKAWEDAGINPETVSLIEAHGTGTKIGDVIEINGLKSAFSKYTDKKQFCAIGSVKSNIGHLYDCAGLVGVLKAVLSLRYKEIPATIGFNQPNPKIDFTESPAYVNMRTKKWEWKNYPRRCGVSSFGIGGTNCHVVLEEAPEIKSSTGIKTKFHVLTLSAKSRSSLHQLIRSYKAFIDSNAHSRLNVGDICYTANTGRGHYDHRLIMIIKDGEDFESKINAASRMEFGNDTDPYVFYGELKGSADKEKERIEFGKKALQKIRDFIDSGYNDIGLIREVCQLYIAGADIDWVSLYGKDLFKKVSIPVYPFECRRCWITIPKTRQADDSIRNDDLYYTIRWKEKQKVKLCEDYRGNTGTILIFKDDNGIGDKLSYKYKSLGIDVVEIEWGDKFQHKGGGRYSISGEQNGYEKLFNTINDKDISQIIHLFSINAKRHKDDKISLNDSQNRGVYSLFRLSKLLNNSHKNIDIVLVSDYVNEVTGNEPLINPENATLFGLAKVIRLENTRLKCRCIDIDDLTDISCIESEIESQNSEFQVAYRNGVRYAEEFSEIEVDFDTTGRADLKSEGIYVITGGTGGIGIEIAKHLSSKCNINIALVNRSGFPERNDWDRILNEGADKNLCRKIKAIRDIESNGSEVIVCCLDISKIEDVEFTFEDLRRKFGKINGVIHGAGVAGSGFMANKDEETLKNILAPKVWGTWVLDKVTEKDNLDFFVMFSSALTIMGEVGQADYVAANSYQDSFAAYRNKKDKRTITINWVAWAETGMAASYGFKSEGAFKQLATQKGILAFEKILGADFKRVIVGELDLSIKTPVMFEKSSLFLSNSVKNKISSINISQNIDAKRGRVALEDTAVKLTGREDGIYTKTEREVAEICKKVLGFSEINIYDSFFELGADSILLKRIFEQLDEIFRDKLSITDLFAYTSVAKLSEFIDAGNQLDSEVKPGGNAEDLNNLFNEIENGTTSIEGAVEHFRRMQFGG